MTKYKTAESVRRGHPDKLCDLIADSILDECLRHDRYSRCACEVMATKGKIFVCGEITCAAKINIRSVVREVLRKVGYNPMKFIVFVYVHRQSPDIAGGVDSALEVRDGSSEEIDTIVRLAFQVNEALKAFFLSVGIRLVDFKLEFGRTGDGTIVLADEISPDTCRLWDKDTNEKLDKDRFRRDLGHVESAYQEVMRRLLEKQP